ncbi:precorrin-8X methylmutase, partial [Salmonella enterica subsp. diarizonae]|nr:precorrin-8X methylmutase [Salmonella enterica subsp. diarizonae]
MHYIQQPQTIEANSFTIISDIIREAHPDYRFASPLHEA